MTEANSPIVSPIVLDQVTMWLDDATGIIMGTFPDRAVLGVEDARMITEIMGKLGGGQARPLFVDFSNLKSQTKECRDYFAKDPKHLETYTAVAILVSSPLSRVIANFFIGINRPLRPTKLFDDQDAAFAWLQAHESDS